MTTVLEARGAGRAYGSLDVLRDVHLRIDAGELVAVVGPSGSGKSTLLSLLGTLDRPTTGTVLVDQVDVAGLSEAGLSALRARAIGFVFQQFHLIPSLTALDNVATGLLYAGTPRHERRTRASEALALCGLASRVGHRPHQLSGGEQQRVAVARAVVGRRRVLLADEPTGALDQASGRAVVALLREVAARGTAVVVVTHDRELAASLPRRVAVRDGRLVEDVRLPVTSGSRE